MQSFNRLRRFTRLHQTAKFKIFFGEFVNQSRIEVDFRREPFGRFV